MSSATPADIERAIRNVPDFPQPGIQFKDITPVLADALLFAGAIDLLTEKFQPGDVDAVVGIDARGFIFAAAAATKLHTGFVPVRKKGNPPTKPSNRITRSNMARRPWPCTWTRSNRGAGGFDRRPAGHRWHRRRRRRPGQKTRGANPGNRFSHSN